MKLVFITNLVHHHQIPVADEFYNILGDDYKYIATEPLPDWLIKGGYDPNIDRPYIVRPYNSQQLLQEAIDLALNADVVIIGSAPEFYVTDRINAGKLTFRYYERIFKSRPWYMTTPRGWINLYKHHIQYRNKPLYMLCASAYTAKDFNTIGAYKNKCFKWGYMTKVDVYNHIADVNVRTEGSENKLRIMWCARFLKLKHPELPVKLASRLKEKGYHFELNMFGSGEELEATKDLVSKLSVGDCVNFCGNKSNDEILAEMRQHDVFLFTSDRNEGWGAVLNEAMSSKCAVVGSNKIGSVPYLIIDGFNGRIFQSENIDSLEEKVVFLIDNPNIRKQLSENAYLTMRNVWSPQNAVRNFFSLVEAIIKCDDSLIPTMGPCSKA